MNKLDFDFRGRRFQALTSGALYWPDADVLVVSDLHFGKSERIARRGGPLLPPYEVRETLSRLDQNVSDTNPTTVICLGDSFDDMSVVESVIEDEAAWLTRLMAGREWIWIEGNHDPGPIGLGGSHRREVNIKGIDFRHIADESSVAEISGHYHPKTRISVKSATLSRPCFLFDDDRMILPAYGTYTGGLNWDAAPLKSIMKPTAAAILTGKKLFHIPSLAKLSNSGR
ncbi:MAG: ligase-associated DNA damage response endonuclease PdeM [Paracoccaceae bacterium]|nr:ligase-associated DNA damage response endonuclease PdeM [Paracoccaceae bacterium]